VAVLADRRIESLTHELVRKIDLERKLPVYAPIRGVLTFEPGQLVAIAKVEPVRPVGTVITSAHGAVHVDIDTDMSVLIEPDDTNVRICSGCDCIAGECDCWDCEGRNVSVAGGGP